MKNITLVILMAIAITNATAQKLPNIQPVSLRAPANVKIDGKATEWGKTLQAYNSSTEVNYTMANDDKKLYLVVQASSWSVLTNIVNGGIKLIIQKAGNKSDAGAPFIKYPYMVKSSVMVDPKVAGDADAENVMTQNNKLLAAKVKWIYTRGIAGVDSIISVYNDRGIEVANAFDTKRRYTLEMAIDLSLVGLSVDNANKFSYRIMVNAEPNRYTMNGIMDIFKSVSDRTPGLTAAQQQNVESFQRAAANATAPTDFWGEYTLTK